MFSVLLILAVVAFGLNALPPIQTKINLDAAGKALVVAAVAVNLL